MATFGAIRTSVLEIIQREEFTPFKLQLIEYFSLFGFILFGYMASIEIRYFLMRLFKITEWSSWVVLRMIAQFLYHAILHKVIVEFVRRYLERQRGLINQRVNTIERPQ